MTTSPNPPPVIYSPEYQALLKRLAAAEAVCEALIAINEDCTQHRITLPGEIDTALDLIPAWQKTRDGQ